MSPAESSQPKPGFVAVFVGATRGIGLATLKALTRKLKKPRFYVIGRSQVKFEPELAALRECNPDAEIRFLEGKISLLKEVDDVCDSILQIESHLDLLYMSPGSLAFGGPHYTEEKIDLCFALSFYIRMRFIDRLLPILLQASKPRVLSVLAGGHETPLYTEGGDIGLQKEGNYTAPRAVNQVTTLHSLAFMHFASQHTKISWLHVYPGWVATDFLSDLLQSAGVVGVVAGKIIAPVYRLVAMSEEECGKRQASYALSGRYPSRDMICAAMVDVNDQAQCHGMCSGFYRVLSDGRTATGDEVLGPLERDGWPLKVSEHLQEVFDSILT
ncbi:hypothetical protein BKA59DRAFT_508773 [Fusarium tricinctum]|uniref:Uncharacterized protein n=1 Tax=Fusarium tricinctum TaxID=61284 RepID=A0A8K0S707_9HYPO|nr:hypothetical protein BKA59DRAFT_508773 [Fusarium tricinctum]